jgi:hypothetical protein
MGDRPVIPVVWLVNRVECWDQALLNDALSGPGWPTGYEFDHRVGLDALSGSGGAIVVVPGANQAGNADAINAALAGLSWALVIVTSDEERRFPLDRLDHQNMRLWLQYPRQGDKADGYLPVGYPPHLRGHLAELPYGKPDGWFFSGQVNNRRRKECVEALRGVDGGSHIETAGFSQGLPHDAYALRLARTRIVPCPSGPRSVDTFRACEALEASCIPVLDGRTPDADASWLWRLALPGVPAPVVDDWGEFPAVATDLLLDWPKNGNQVAAWWHGYKRSLAQRVSDTINDLSGMRPDPGPVTVLIPTSPIASHPDTGVIEETIASVRHWLPDAEIVVMCDGVRAEQEHYRSRYEDYVSRLTWLCGRWDRVLPVIHDGHLHQAEMTRRALDLVRTPLVMFVEHDTPLVTDEPIDFPAVFAAVQSGEVDMVRFHYEGRLHPEHLHLMLDDKPRDVAGAPLIRTVQWSQRPHVANTAFYRRILANDFPKGHRGMIEDVMHGAVHNAWREYGKAGWDRYRLAVYAPDGAHIKRSDHLDGRGADPKWADS